MLTLETATQDNKKVLIDKVNNKTYTKGMNNNQFR